MILADPRIAVVVTNHNYGHLLPGCLASLRAQTVPANEVIVVDDGSEDTSRDFLQDVEDVEVILQDNLGQAAAMNAGYLASESAIVLFLDADDRLLPSAIETVKRLWDPAVATMSFDLQMVDRKGTSLGRYPIDIPSLNRRRLVSRRLIVPFIPTSGNAFSRAHLEWAFPLPQKRWRISADALLVRAGLLSGPSIHLRRILGQYLVHGGNNYYSELDRQKGDSYRGLVDVSDAGIDLLRMSARGRSPLSKSERRHLMEAAYQTRCAAEDIKPNRTSFEKFLKDLRRASVPVDTSPLFRHLPVGVLSRYVGLRRYTENLQARTAEQSSTPEQAQKDTREFDVLVDGDRRLDLALHLTGPGWKFGRFGREVELLSPKGVISICRLSDRPSLLSFSISEIGNTTSFSISLNGKFLDTKSIEGPGVFSVQLPAPNAVCPVVDRIELSVGTSRKISHGLTDFQPLVFSGISIRPLPSVREVLRLPVSDSAPLLPRLRASMLDEPERFLASGEIVQVAAPGLSKGYKLALTFGADQVSGRLSLIVGNKKVLDTHVEKNAICHAEIPPEVESDPLEIEFGFSPEDPLDEPLLHVIGAGWLPPGSGRSFGSQTLSSGARYLPVAAGILGEGWTIEDEGSAVMFAPSASLSVALPPTVSSTQSAIHLDIERLDPALAGEAFVVLLTKDDTVLAQTSLTGRGILTAQLPVDTTSPVSLALHVSPIPIRRHGGLRLNSVSIDAPSPARPEAERPVENSDMKPAEHVLEPEDTIYSVGRDVSNLSASGVAFITPNLLLSRIGQGAAPAPASHFPPFPRSDRAADFQKWYLNVVSAGPAYQVLPSLDLLDLPVGSPAFAYAVARYLAHDPVVKSEDEADRYADWLVRQLDGANGLLKTNASPWHKALAAHFVRDCRPNSLNFFDRPFGAVVAAIGRSIETMLLLEGHDLIGENIRRDDREPNRRTRLGVLLRKSNPSPELWITKALLSRLDRNKIDVTIYLTHGGLVDPTCLNGFRVVLLGGRPLSHAVAEIRGARHDVVLLASYFLGVDPTSLLAAHRLAPRQFAISAAFPTTSGLRSVDTFVAGDLVTPEGAEPDYVERMIRAPGTGQAFDMPLQDPDRENQLSKAIWKSRTGIPDDAVVFVSGAMLDKIVPQLLETWLSILADVPNSVLVLYPFAPSWTRNYDIKAFTQTVRTACERRSVALDRMVILPPIEHEEVLDVLRCADVYLDSFPYSGATTIVEAARAGLPIVSKAGQSQRCHQGAGWLTAMGAEDMIAANASDYIHKAVELGRSEEARRNASNRIEASREAAFAQDSFHAWFSDFIRPQKFGSPPRYIFHHLPKTGGTTARSILADWFKIVPDYRKAWSDVVPEPLDLSLLSEDEMLAGHFESEVMQIERRYPETIDTEKWRRITFLRDPLELALSIYFYERARRGNYDAPYVPQPLGEFLRTYKGIYLWHFACGELDWREALDKYWFVGTLERFEESLQWLSSTLGKDMPEATSKLNVTPRDELPSAEDIEIFLQRHAVEYDIYREVDARLSARLKSLPHIRIPL